MYEKIAFSEAVQRKPLVRVLCYVVILLIAAAMEYFKEVIRGRTATTLAPQGTATRAEIAAIFNRYLSLDK